MLLFDGLGVGVALAEAHSGKVVLANKTFGQMFGFDTTRAWKIQTSIFDLTHPHDRDEQSTEWLRLCTGESARCSFDKRYVRANGDIVWSHTTLSPLRETTGGGIRWIACAFEDVTEQKELRDQIEMAERLAGLVTWNFSVGVGTIDASSRYSSVLGMKGTASSKPSLEEFLQQVHPDDKKSVQTTIKRALRGAPYTHEYRVILPDGGIRWLRGMANVVKNSAGKVTNLIGATMDITDARIAKNSAEPPRAIREFIKYIEVNWNSPISISKVARQQGLSPRRLHKYFATQGTTPLGLVKQKKLQHARMMLSRPDKTTSVSLVAHECGFGNLGHFAKDYRTQFGELPSETLSKHKEK